MLLPSPCSSIAMPRMTALQPGPGAADGAERAALFARATSERAAMGKHAWVAAEITCQKAFPKGARAARHGCSTAGALCGKTPDRYSKKLPDSPDVKSLRPVTPITGPRDPILHSQPPSGAGLPPGHLCTLQPPAHGILQGGQQALCSVPKPVGTSCPPQAGSAPPTSPSRDGPVPPLCSTQPCSQAVPKSKMLASGS